MKLTRRSFLKSTAAAAAVAALAGIAAQAEGEEASFSYTYDGEVPAADSYPIAPEEFGSGDVKYTIEEMSDGWVKVVNEGGAVLGYSEKSGVSLIQVDGYAFKNLSQSGSLELYEDWRQPAEVRAEDLASRLSGEEIAPLLTHGGWSVFASDISKDEYLLQGGRAGVTRSAGVNGNQEIAVKWINAMQEYCEGTSYGIPATVSIDPNNISSTVDQNGLAATMDVELAAEVAKQNAKDWRACGITMLLGPQIDIATESSWCRSSGAYTEDPALARDMAKAYINALQSTYDEDGNDLGWGSDSVAAMCKHYVGAGASEGGRNDHFDTGKYCVYPGNNFAAHLIPFFDGAFQLEGKTEKAAAVMPNYGIAYSEDGSLGDLVGGAYSSYKIGLLRENGWDGFIVTDWQVTNDGAECYGVEDLTKAQRMAKLFENDVDQIGGDSEITAAVEAWGLVCDDLGEEEALANFRNHARRFFLTQMNTGLYENPYITTEGISQAYGEEHTSFGYESQLAGAVMIKNAGNAVHAFDETAEKPKCYIPYSISVSGNIWFGFTYTCGPVFDIELASKYYTVVTDSCGEPTGEDGNYQMSDIVRADASEIAACEYALVAMKNCYTSSTTDAFGNYLPASMQYSEYTDTTSGGAIAQDTEMVQISDGYYGYTYQEQTISRSTEGNTTAASVNYSSLETLQYVKSVVSDDCKVIVTQDIPDSGTMVISEVEPLADAIICYYEGGNGTNLYPDELQLKLIGGEYEPKGLLIKQIPASMEAVEAQLEDVPRDAEVYVDSEGNTYDFCFGMNWSGIIDDERTATYNVPALTSPETIEFHYA